MLASKKQWNNLHIMKECKKYLFLNFTLKVLFKESAMLKLHSDLDKVISDDKGT